MLGCFAGSLSVSPCHHLDLTEILMKMTQVIRPFILYDCKYCTEFEENQPDIEIFSSHTIGGYSKKKEFALSSLNTEELLSVHMLSFKSSPIAAGTH